MNLPWFTKYPYQNDEILNLDWLLNQLNEFRNSFEEWKETIEALQEALKDIDDWETRINTLEVLTAQMESKLKVLEKSITDLANLEAADVTYLKKLIDDLQNQINALDISALKVYVDSRDNEIIADYNKKFYDAYVVTYSLFNGLKTRVEILAQIVAEIDTKAYNPWARRLVKESLQTNLNYAYADLADNVPTATDYAGLGLTAEDYSDKDMLARDYSLRGKFLLKMHFVYSPTYGFKQEISNVLTGIVDFIKGTMSADEYTALDIDAEDYSALDLTAEEYYSYGSNPSGIVGTGGTGLTSEQYSTLQIL